MKKIKQLKWLLPMLLHICFVQANAQLNMGEYFFDTDPGVGNGYPITTQSVLAGPIYDSTQSTSIINIPNWMSPGVHTLYVRYGDFNNINGRNWSNYEARKFTVNPPSGNGFAQAEYFFDTDPGLGNATSLPLLGNPDSSNFAGNVSTIGLTPGIHTLHVRCKMVTGYWSNYETRKIIVNVANGSSIIAAEYFYDVDPGFGNATIIPLSGNTDSSSFSGNVGTAGLSFGTHQLCIRSKKANGEWGVYEIRKVKILNAGNSLSQAEYFYDTDPGVGNGSPISLIHTNDSSSFTGNIPSTGLSGGKHMFYVRAKNIEGKWSLYEERKIIVNSYATSGEYFFDDDPGAGNGNAFVLNNIGNSLTEFAGGLITDINLSYGHHTMYSRLYTVKDGWGNFDSVGLFINCKNPSLPIVTQTNSTECGVEGVLLSTTSDSLNDAAYWNWYSGSCGGNLVGTGNTLFVSPNDTSTYYIKGEGGCVFTAPCTSIQVNLNPASTVSLKLFIEGFYDAGSMTTALLNEGQPSCNNVTDTVMVQLHDPLNYSLIIEKLGVLYTDGTLKVNFSPYLGNYYVAIKHRNSIETWTANPVTLTNEAMIYDFTNMASQAFGDNMTEVATGVWAFYSGDINKDGTIDVFDYLLLDPDIQIGEFGYLPTDLNGDGSIDAFDYIVLDPNIVNGIGLSTP